MDPIEDHSLFFKLGEGWSRGSSSEGFFVCRCMWLSHVCSVNTMCAGQKRTQRGDNRCQFCPEHDREERRAQRDRTVSSVSVRPFIDSYFDQRNTGSTDDTMGDHSGANFAGSSGAVLKKRPLAGLLVRARNVARYSYNRPTTFLSIDAGRSGWRPLGGPLELPDGYDGFPAQATRPGDMYFWGRFGSRGRDSPLDVEG